MFVNSTALLLDSVYQMESSNYKEKEDLASVGCQCLRKLWLDYHWAEWNMVPGHEKRLRRYCLADAVLVIGELKEIGVQIEHSSLNDPMVFDDDPMTGMVDGVITGFLPEDPRGQYILAVRNVNSNDFRSFVASGCATANRELHTEIQILCLKAREKYPSLKGIFLAILSRNTCDLYTEVISFDEKFAVDALERARKAMVSQRPAPRITNRKECERCRYNCICNVTRMVTQVNCRTCAFATAYPDGTWKCDMHNRMLDADIQKKSWNCHVFHPDLVECWKWHQDKSSNTDFLFETENGGTFWNGINSWRSKDIADGKHNATMKLTDAFKGTVINGA